MTLTDGEIEALLRSTSNCPPEDWGEAWIVMRRCLERFDPGRGVPFERMFRASWARRRIDIARLRSRHKRIGKLPTVSFDAALEMPAKNGTTPRRIEPERVLKLLSPSEVLLFRCVTEIGYQRTAIALRMPEGTVKSQVVRIRANIRALLEDVPA